MSILTEFQHRKRKQENLAPPYRDVLAISECNSPIVVNKNESLDEELFHTGVWGVVS